MFLSFICGALPVIKDIIDLTEVPTQDVEKLEAVAAWLPQSSPILAAKSLSSPLIYGILEDAYPR